MPRATGIRSRRKVERRATRKAPDDSFIELEDSFIAKKDEQPKPQQRYDAKEEEDAESSAPPSSSNEQDEEEEEWHVEKIVGHRPSSDDPSQREYCVKWRDWPSTSNTWEPMANVTHCQ